ncbi:MAG: RNA pyrophosphohydrolase [candidate division WS6 bacterium OLB20]|uniref:RNA pyrophosphohydrolase n=1 Tax=candidate division WS6 bacterium OLB20 TaxID=1617426 RepID=A0A136LX59_9BACT|nr:MAG: RNA pyrophosphohydrolase [candidate division WS6 bacterium OLB20]
MEIKRIPMLTVDGERRFSLGAGCVIVMQGKVLLVRTAGSDLYKFPGGHAADTENLREAALRELTEETGLSGEVTGDPFVYLFAAERDLDILLFHYPARIISGKPSPSTEIEEVIWADVKNLPRNCYDNVDPTLEKMLLQPV